MSMSMSCWIKYKNIFFFFKANRFRFYCTVVGASKLVGAGQPKWNWQTKMCVSGVYALRSVHLHNNNNKLLCALIASD